MVMHDLRSPIKNIKLLTHMLREDGNESEVIDFIDRSAEQASEIFDDFLDFVNNTPVKKLPVDLNKIADEAIETAEINEHSAQITITKNIPENLVIHGDESKLRRTIVNLVNNAVDALYDNKVPNAAVSITAFIQDGNVIINISDNGPGITDEIMTTLFEPFVTKNKVKGTGLGLAIVKQYITAHGGDIEVSNNNGATFTITLPL
jgi:two-component system, NtrC family, sensor kinase